MAEGREWLHRGRDALLRGIKWNKEWKARPCKRKRVPGGQKAVQFSYLKINLLIVEELDCMFPLQEKGYRRRGKTINSKNSQA